VAWVTLHNLLETDKNLHGLIPHSAPVKLLKGPPGDDFIAANCLLLFRNKAKEELERYVVDADRGRVMSLADFIATYPGMSGTIEWNITEAGHVVHFSDGLYDRKELNGLLKKKGASFRFDETNKFGFLTYCVLDLTGWLSEQPADIIQRLAVHFVRDADKREEWVKKFVK